MPAHQSSISLLVALLGVIQALSAETTVACVGSERVRYGLDRLELAVAGCGAGPLRRLDPAAAADIRLVLASAPGWKLPAESYRIRRRSGGIDVTAGDETGAMYGLLDLAEQVAGRGSLRAVVDSEIVPRFSLRAVKFNLPWSCYRPSNLLGDARYQHGLAVTAHLAPCRDLAFWRRFLDMMADSRLNTLSLWNFHPFTHMIRPTNFPKACGFTDAELKDWQDFYHGLFALAAARGVQIHLLNWNIFVSPEFAEAYGAKFSNDTSEVVKQYTRECVTQLIDEYPEIAGFGVAVGEGMKKMSSREREQWLLDTVVTGLRAAKRPVTFIHRAPFEGSTAEDFRWAMDRVDLPGPLLAEIKFNWSHGHSTPRMQVTHSLKIDGLMDRPKPTNFKVAWTIRNEDLFILRWGDPDFVRAHIAANGSDLVTGYFIGSEGYIPAADLSHRPSPHLTWSYAFEKQWLFYTVWGRLLHDPGMRDERLVWAFAARHGKHAGERLLAAWRLASRVPLRIASFYAGTWDYTLYSEGFSAYAASRGPFDGKSPLISVDELIGHETLDPAYLSVRQFLDHRGPLPADRVTPLALADICDSDADEVLAQVAALKAGSPAPAGALLCELDDLATWAHLGRYFADKLRGAVALARWRDGGKPADQQEAVQRLERALGHWRALAKITEAHYHPIPHVAGPMFSWAGLLPAVERDVATAREAVKK